jgi:hypothetical protein
MSSRLALDDNFTSLGGLNSFDWLATCFVGEVNISDGSDLFQIKKVGSNPRTVKNILNNAMANKSKSDVEAPEDLKTEKKEKTEEEVEKISENAALPLVFDELWVIQEDA